MPLGVPSSVATLAGFGGGESWQDRLREAAYKSPKGTRITFEYEDVGRAGTKRGTVFEFPGVDDGYVQQKGFGPRRYPMRCFFSGAEHDRIATAFEAALYEPGRGELEHPLYGKIKHVVPFGDITRRDDLATAANQSVLEVTFWTTIAELYPAASTSPENEILAALDGFDVVAAQRFEDSTSLLSTVQKANAKATIREFLRTVSGALSDVSGATAAVRREFADNVALVNQGIDVFIGQPLLLARQISDLIKAPARALAGIRSRLNAYADLAEKIFGSKAGRPGDRPIAIASNLTLVRNDLEIARLFASSAVAGAILSLVENTFETKPEVLDAAERGLNQFDAFVDWNDSAFAAVGAVDTGEDYQALLDAVGLAAGYLVEISFQVVPERRIVLDRARTIIDLAAELYGVVDARLDFLISSNALSGSEILELPAGRTILYYPT